MPLLIIILPGTAWRLGIKENIFWHEMKPVRIVSQVLFYLTTDLTGFLQPYVRPRSYNVTGMNRCGQPVKNPLPKPRLPFSNRILFRLIM
jgi:hypothetical protein